MSDEVTDNLWPHFAPLWKDLRQIAPDLLLVGGYGLFLKQQWLLSQFSSLGPETGDATVTQRGEELVVNEVRTVVPIERWKNQTPRVTKDFDFIASLDLIASTERQNLFNQVLIRHGFSVVEKNARWQFEKEISNGNKVVLDFHSPLPDEKRDDLRVDERRVKPNPSLHKSGIHGHKNAEAAGSELHPFPFIYRDVKIQLPNPVTLTLMKLIATRDRWREAQDTLSSGERQAEGLRQARKHAEDVCRVIAMMTRDERDSATIILDAVRGKPVFADGRSTFSELFKTDEGWGSQAVIDKWENDDFQIIRKTLDDWYG